MTRRSENLLRYDDVLAELREIVRGSEDYVYPYAEYGIQSCLYFEEGRPSCIVGHWLYKHGRVPDSDEIEGMNVDEVCNIFEVDVSLRGAALLQAAQALQDLGTPWGAAVDDAVKEVAETLRLGIANVSDDETVLDTYAE
jgi:hypothetical protein